MSIERTSTTVSHIKVETHTFIVNEKKITYVKHINELTGEVIERIVKDEFGQQMDWFLMLPPGYSTAESLWEDLDSTIPDPGKCACGEDH